MLFALYWTYSDEQQSDCARAGSLTTDLDDEDVEYPGGDDGHDRLDGANRRVPASGREPTSRVVGSCESVSRQQRLGTDYDGSEFEGLAASNKPSGVGGGDSQPAVPPYPTRRRRRPRPDDGVTPVRA